MKSMTVVHKAYAWFLMEHAVISVAKIKVSNQSCHAIFGRVKVLDINHALVFLTMNIFVSAKSYSLALAKIAYFRLIYVIFGSFMVINTDYNAIRSCIPIHSRIVISAHNLA